MEQCYITNQTTGLRSVKPEVVLKWAGYKDEIFRGACFGLAGISQMAFINYTDVTAKFPNTGITSSSLNMLTPTDGLRSAIQQAYTAQFSNEYLNICFANQNKHVSEQFDRMKNMMADTIRDNDMFMSFWFQLPSGDVDGGHAINPYYICKNPEPGSPPGSYIVLFYNNNDGANFIDTLTINIYEHNGNGAMRYKQFPSYSSKNAFGLFPAAGIFSGSLSLPSQVSKNNYTLSRSISGKLRFAFDENEKYAVTNSLNQTNYWDGATSMGNIDSGMLVYPFTGYHSVPRNMYLPIDNYTIQTTQTQNGAAGFFVFDNQASYYLQRYNAQTGENDNFSYNTGPAYTNASGSNRLLHIEVVTDTNNVVKDYKIDSLVVSNNSNIGVTTDDNNNVVIKTGSAPSSYSITVKTYSDTLFTTFHYPNIPIAANTLHVVQATNSQNNNVIIFVDNGQNGTYEDTLFYQNQAPAVLEFSKYSSYLGAPPQTDTVGIANTGGGSLTWQVISSPSWITILQGNSGSQQGKIIYTTQTNISTLRKGYIVVAATGAINSPDSIEITQEGYLVIAESEMSNDIVLIYPNPATDQLILQCETEALNNAVIEIFDLNGRKLLETNSSGTNKISLDIAGLSSGSYVVSIKGKHTMLRKIFTKL